MESNTLQTLRAMLVGQTETDALELCRKYGWLLRVKRRDGECFFGTADYMLNRINCSVDDGIVTKVTCIG